MRVIQLAEGAIFAGIEAHILALAPALRDRGVDVRVVTFADGELSARLEALGIPHESVRRRHKFDRRPIREIAELALATGAILHTHGYLADIYAWRAAERARFARVATVHGHREPYPGWKGMRMRAYLAADLSALRSADRVIAVSEPLRAQLAMAGVDARLRVVPNGLSPGVASAADIETIRAQLTAPGVTNVIGYVGRFDPVKAPMRFLEIAANILAERGDVRFAMAGEGPLLAACRERAREMNIDRAVTFLGFRKDIDAVLGAFDILLMPSDSEGVPQALLAAMRDRVAPVCSRVGGIPAILDGAESCLAAPETAALTERVFAMLDAARREPVVSALKTRFEEHYTAAAMARAVHDVYIEASG
ncbi:glycosyltransferase family 4 protein [bacterium]|nr:glycosyltransferase family 4 protein [bacterium]